MPARPRVDRIRTVYSAAKKLNFGFRMTGFPDAPFLNGVADYRPQLHRITFKFCKKREDSVGMRNFIETSLVKFGTENPSCAVYVIPESHSVPTMRAEYSNGRMVHVNASNMSLEQVHLHANNLRTRSGLPVVKFEARQTAQCKSVQGAWNPLLWQDSRKSATQLPQPDFSAARHVKPTLTDFVKFVAEPADND
ncbi:mitochondrial ribosomal protein l51 / s25 / CI-B8 domain-containing protein [Ditylenchus destructor]|uniref:Large ribosomal subunit protein mL43 n=1 Tax=Ditylenchus destructor TaxID=166010 RepID=A0AAD4R790_9BILA|nr:mitochondrial ribosomal protein l51 / s25 / CI-B8 domain-containing protein [Ditylenchus destructor]